MLVYRAAPQRIVRHIKLSCFQRPRWHVTGTLNNCLTLLRESGINMAKTEQALWTSGTHMRKDENDVHNPCRLRSQ